MKLVSCYIENFGGLSGYSLDFEAGLTTVHAPNGFGKTTLAEFIRAMFYGFPRKTKLGKRERYQPWNGGRFGGSLTFEHEGRRYRIERSFGARDTFALFDLQTGKKSAAFTKNIGQELFGLDADSFERSTYLPQEPPAGTLATNSIRAKLAGLVEDTGDVGNFQKALDALDKKRKHYAHKIGTGGAVAEDIQQISDIQKKLDAARDDSEMLPDVTAQIEALTRECSTLDGALSELRTAISAANEAAARQTHQQHYASLEEARRAAAEERDTLLASFPGPLPTERDCGEAAAALEELAGLEARTITTAADETARRFVSENSGRFGGGLPDGTALDSIRELCTRRAETATALSGCPMTDEGPLEEASRFLAPGIPAAETLAGHQAALEKARELRQQNMELAAAPAMENEQKKNPLAPVSLILGLLLAAGGIVLLSGGDFAPGGVLLGLGVLALVAAAWLSLRTAARSGGPAPELQALIRGNEERAKALESDVRRFTAAYYPGDPERALTLIREHIRAYQELTEEKARHAEKRRTLKAEIAACDGKLKGFFLGWGMAYNGDPRDLLEALIRDCIAWENAMTQLADLEQRQGAHRQTMEQVRQRLEEFRQRYGMIPGTRQEAEDLRSAVWNLEKLGAEIKKLDRQLADYRRDHGDALTGPAGAGEDPAALAEREQELIRKRDENAALLPGLRQQAQKYREAAEAVPALTDSLAHWQAKKEADEHCAALLDDTQAFLTQARENLATAYMGPIRESFTALMERLMDEGRERILVTEDLDVLLERGGESRPLAYFSAGQTDLVRLCMRLALVDALFREAKPFVILDDPFVNLDDERLPEALKLLSDLSRDRQILYLTCNSSRL